jgi:hypothetical protein
MDQVQENKELHSLARKIVNPLYERAKVDVATRQLLNDWADEHVIVCVREFLLERSKV